MTCLNTSFNPICSHFLFYFLVKFLSLFVQPHFLGADERLIQSVEGLAPSTLVHDTFIDVETYTGISMRASKRMQFSSVLTSWDMSVFGDEELQAPELPGCHDHWARSEWKWTVNSEVDGLYIPMVW
jgi:hypothetical protein